MPLDALVALHDLFGVDRQLLVRIDDHAEEAGVGLKKDNKKYRKLDALVLISLATMR